MPTEATGPSCFTHSCEVAYFSPSKTTKGNDLFAQNIGKTGDTTWTQTRKNILKNFKHRHQKLREREKKVTRGEASVERECWGERGLGREPECIGGGRSPHPQCHGLSAPSQWCFLCFVCSAQVSDKEMALYSFCVILSWMNGGHGMPHPETSEHKMICFCTSPFLSW